MNLNTIIIFSLLLIFLLLILKNISLCNDLENYVNGRNNRNQFDFTYKITVDMLKNNKICKEGLSNNEIDNYNKTITPMLNDIFHSQNLKNMTLGNQDFTCLGSILDAVNNNNAIKMIKIIDQIILFLNDVKKRLTRL